MWHFSFKYIYTCLGLLFVMLGCTPQPHDVVPATDVLCIYPDYQDITVPCNIAPLNFMMRGDYDAISIAITATNAAESKKIADRKANGAKVIFDTDSWHEMLCQHQGEHLQITVTARQSADAQWVQFPPFSWTISTDSIDSYLTYRLIEPGYEVWDKVCIEERCTENFSQRLLADGRELGNRCMNCHTHGGDRGQYSFFYVRGEKGGAIVNREGHLRKVTLKNDKMCSGTVYGDWHQSGRYAVYSSNIIIPAFHRISSRRLEVFDSQSDLCVVDFERDSLLLCPLVSNTAASFETFPTFSADGRSIYFCSAQNTCGDTIPSVRDLRPTIEQLHYSLCRIAFDAETGQFGETIDTLYDAMQENASINFPKCSSDGKWLCYTQSDYGTFPIWHKEAKLCLMDLTSADSPTIINTQENGTYHSWSHNSKWIAFASKRVDGQYGRVYFMHINDDGTCTKPLVLPQADPEMDDWNLRSYNIPDLSTLSVPFGERDVKMLVEDMAAIPFK